MRTKSETNIHYNKDCDFIVVRQHKKSILVGNKHPLQQGLRHLTKVSNFMSDFVGNKRRKQTSTTTRIATSMYKCAVCPIDSSETNIHYNKDCDFCSLFRIKKSSNLSETNIHYNKDCDRSPDRLLSM